MPVGGRFVFASFELDPSRRRLLASGEPVVIPERHLDVLGLLVARAGQIVSKDDLIRAGWQDVAVGDNSLEQAISSLRRRLGTNVDGTALIATVPRRGYRLTAVVSRTAARESEAGLEALLVPHRAFIEGRAALESLAADQVSGARGVFTTVVRDAPEYAAAHVGLANACVMQYEMTRADAQPDAAALAQAERHAREACRLDPQSAEAWATLGFVLDRTGHNLDARAASNRAVSLEPDNWRHSLPARLRQLGRGAPARRPPDPRAAARLSVGALARGHGPRRAAGADGRRARDRRGSRIEIWWIRWTLQQRRAALDAGAVGARAR